MAKREKTTLRFDSIQDALAYAEKLVALESEGKVKMTGGWSLGQNLSHLEKSIRMSIHGAKRPASVIVQFGAKLRKKAFLKNGLPAGIPLNNRLADLSPDNISSEEALVKLQHAITDFHQASSYAAHPIFGKLTHEETNAFHCRHMELHLSHAKIESQA